MPFPAATNFIKENQHEILASVIKSDYFCFTILACSLDRRLFRRSKVVSDHKGKVVSRSRHAMDHKGFKMIWQSGWGRRGIACAVWWYILVETFFNILRRSKCANGI
ncbi:hypothetical protein P8452_42634 [Trifolium repens]|nr:hypothetical protein P8452_42634 [Trifolium repens]